MQAFLRWGKISGKKNTPAFLGKKNLSSGGGGGDSVVCFDAWGETTLSVDNEGIARANVHMLLMYNNEET